MKPLFLFAALLILIGSDCEIDWVSAICSGESEGGFLEKLALRTWCKFQDTKATAETIDVIKQAAMEERYVLDDSKCPKGVHYDKQMNKCLSCGKNAQLNLNTGQCACNPSFVPDEKGGCREKTAQEQQQEAQETYPARTGNECVFSSDCAGRPGFGTCANEREKVRYDCIDGYCKRQDFSCPGGCKGGECQ